MSTMKYKATERYAMGWTDPRGTFGQGKFYTVFEAVAPKNKNLDTAATSVLRDLWLFTFGDAPVSHGAMCEHLDTDDDIFWVGHELWKRKQIEAITMRFPDRDETFSGYKLVREGESLGDN